MSTQTTLRTAAQIRREFLDYFAEQHGHTVVPSAPVVPHNDPSLLFTNAGMNQFKDVFLGRGRRPYVRAVDTQKCIRAGGKHNDLEDVGKDTYHHTFFEMLGNWSFGDYFKPEAIEWAWDLLTNVWGIDPERLHATYFEGDPGEGLEPDHESRELWRRHLPDDRIHPGNKKDNFWEMGDTGPCGPCSEIHYDSTPDFSGGSKVNAGDEAVIELWNLVFIQFNRAPGSGGQRGTLTPLPAKHVDTGLGLERVVRILQGKTSSYDTDLFTPLFAAIHKATGARAYEGGEGTFDDAIDTAYRVIADHVRCLTVAISDGAIPSNEGRGYVLRRILRRAVRHAHQTLSQREPVLYNIVPSVVESLADAFSELSVNQEKVEQTIQREEEAFLRTLDRGVELWWQYAYRALATRISEEYAKRADGKGFFLLSGGAVPSRIESEKEELREQIREHGIIPLHPTYTVDIFDYRDPSKAIASFRASDLSADIVKRFTTSPPVIAADGVFQLHDTYGFPIDLTRIMAEERGMTVDEAGFETLMVEARERSRQKPDGETEIDLPPHALAQLKYKKVPPTDDIDKYHGRPVTARVAAIWNGTDFDNVARSGRRLAVILDRTAFYSEQGGQVGDTGVLRGTSVGAPPAVGDTISSPSAAGTVFQVENTMRVGDYVLHVGDVRSGAIRVDDRITADVSEKHRHPTKWNHTATHLLNHALRQVLGDDVQQKGSLVAPDRLRFDFSFSRAMTPDEVNAVERLINAAIHQALPVHVQEVSLDNAQQFSGVRAVFGEQYPDPVRVIAIGPSIDRLIAQPDLERWRECSIEFCGGTHVENTREIRRCVIVSEQALAAGVRRIVAVTGPAALAADGAGRELEARCFRAKSLSGDEIVREVAEIGRLVDELTIGAVAKTRIHCELESLRDRAKHAQKKAQQQMRGNAVDQARFIAENIQGRILAEEVIGVDTDALLAGLDVLKARRPEAAAMLISGNDVQQKVLIVARVPKEMNDQGLKAGDWVREAAAMVGGGGGGRPDMAQAGGKDPKKINDAIARAKQFAEDALKT